MPITPLLPHEPLATDAAWPRAMRADAGVWAVQRLARRVFAAAAAQSACALVLAGLSGAALAQGPTQSTPGAPAAAAAAPAANCPAVLQHTMLRLQDEKPQALCQYAGRVLLVVNTASFCGFTPQYEGLEALHARYKDKGLVVLGFPSNDFSQESGSNKQIADFCESTFGVKFPMFTKTRVTGAQAAPLFRQLAQATGKPPQWNFHKYLVGRDGRVIGSYPSRIEPLDVAFVAEIERQLRTR